MHARMRMRSATAVVIGVLRCGGGHSYICGIICMQMHMRMRAITPRASGPWWGWRRPAGRRLAAVGPGCLSGAPPPAARRRLPERAPPPQAYKAASRTAAPRYALAKSRRGPR